MAAVPVDHRPERVRGRDALLETLQRRLRAGGLVVLAGAGGTGKSTAARELARRMPRARRGPKTPGLEGSRGTPARPSAGPGTGPPRPGARRAGPPGLPGPGP